MKETANMGMGIHYCQLCVFVKMSNVVYDYDYPSQCHCVTECTRMLELAVLSYLDPHILDCKNCGPGSWKWFF